MGSQSVLRRNRIMFHGSGDIPTSHDAHITDFPKFEQGQWSLDSAVPFWDLAEISSVRCRCVMISVKLDVIMYGSTWKHLEAVGGTVICTKTPELQMLTKSTNKQGFYDDLRSDNDLYAWDPLKIWWENIHCERSSVTKRSGGELRSPPPVTHDRVQAL